MGNFEVTAIMLPKHRDAVASVPNQPLHQAGSLLRARLCRALAAHAPAGEWHVGKAVLRASLQVSISSRGVEHMTVLGPHGIAGVRG